MYFRDKLLPKLTAVSGLIALWWSSFHALLATPFWADDQPNSMRRAVLEYTRQTPWRFIRDAVQQWKMSEGRFFPVSTIENVYTFLWFDDRVEFKRIQLLSVLIVALLVSVVVREITVNWRTALIGSAVFLIVVQVRMWYDPTIGFGLLLQSVTAKLLVAIWGTLRILRASLWTQVVGYWLVTCIVWVAAVFQYEVVVFVLPVFVVLCLMPNRQAPSRILGALAATGLPTLSAIVISFFLRSDRTTSAAYAISFGSGSFWRAFAMQLMAGLPLSAGVFQHYMLWIVGSALSFLISAALIMFLIQHPTGQRRSSDRASVRPLVVIGIGLAILPAFPVAISRRWQQELSWGQGYLAVFLQYVGIAFLITSLLVWLQGRWQEKESRARYITLICSVMAISAVAGSHFASESDVVKQMTPITHRRELFENAVRGGFLGGIPAQSSIISPNYDPNAWFNPWYYQWLGGSDSHKLSGTSNGMLVACTQVQEPAQCSPGGPWWGFVELPAGEGEVVDVIGQYVRLDADPMTTDLLPGTVKATARVQKILPTLCRKDVVRTEYGNWVGTCDVSVTKFVHLKNLVDVSP